MSFRAGMQAVLSVYQDGREVTNEELYRAVREPLGLSDDAFDTKQPVGSTGKKHCLATRKIRWFQQSLRKVGALERVPGRRGLWRLAVRDDGKLTPAVGMTLVGFSTHLGVALWSSCDVFAKINEPIAVIITSPPYPLAKPRLYGGPTEVEMVDFVCAALEPLIKNLLPGGSLALNCSNDIFLKGSPARSMYVERLVLAIHSRLGLSLMDRMVWTSPKPPGPMAWASGTRQQLNVGYEHVLWFSPDPARCFADNRRVLEPHSDRHLKLVARGGEGRTVVNGDGAYRLREGVSFSSSTPGRIPRNVMAHSHKGREITALRAAAKAHGLPVHGALMPLSLASFLVKFLSMKDQLVVDPWGGWATTALAAEDNGRRWLVTERMAEYVAAQALRFRDCAGFRSSFDVAVRLSSS